MTSHLMIFQVLKSFYTGMDNATMSIAHVHILMLAEVVVGFVAVMIVWQIFMRIRGRSKWSIIS